MRRIFVDTCYLVGLIDEKDDLHDICVNTSQNLEKSGPLRLYISEFIFNETLNYFSKYTSFWKQKASEMIKIIKADPNVEVIPHTTNLYESGQELYDKRIDKDYSHTDCTSMIIMKDKGINEILTHDHHFEQEGFTILLK